MAYVGDELFIGPRYTYETLFAKSTSVTQADEDNNSISTVETVETI